MAPAAALLVVPDGLGSSEWQHAIVTFSHERPTSRLYVFFQRGGDVPDRRLFSLATRAFQALATEAPRLDLVPLFPAAGWSLHQASCLPDIDRLLVLPPPCGDGDAAVALSASGADVAAEVCSYRAAASLPQLNVQRLPAGGGSPPRGGVPQPHAFPVSPVPFHSAGGEDRGEDKSAGDGGTATAGAVNTSSTAAADADDDEPPDGCYRYDAVAVGGTFDRLHGGHRLLLCVAACVCARPGGTLYVGVTVDELLYSKKLHHLVEPLQVRTASALAFVAAVAPGLQVETSALSGGPPKAVTWSGMQALVVSRETLSGAMTVQQQRAERGFVPLRLLTVDLVGAASQEPLARKLSSSSLREMEHAAAAGGAGKHYAQHGGAAAAAAAANHHRLPPTVEHRSNGT